MDYGLNKGQATKWRGWDKIGQAPPSKKELPIPFQIKSNQSLLQQLKVLKIPKLVVDFKNVSLTLGINIFDISNLFLTAQPL